MPAMWTENTSKAQAPYLELSLPVSPFLADDHTMPSSSTEEDELLSTTLAKRLATPLRAPPLLTECTPMRPSISIDPQSLKTTTKSYSSIHSIPFVEGSDSIKNLSRWASEPQHLLPHASGRISTKQIQSVLALLDKFDDDVEGEVLRVQKGIQEVKDLVALYKSERSGRKGGPKEQRISISDSWLEF